MKRLTKALQYFCASSLLLIANAAGSAEQAGGWPAWEGFKRAFVSQDGRVVDHSQEDLRTVSEGQSYALFFALVARDRRAFDLMLKWTENNLSSGDLGRQLPAWHWGRKNDGWGVIDSNSASDADLWIAYALLEAGRLWCHEPYTAKARALGELILKNESLEVSGLGLSILPGHSGFVLADGTVKLNPSYVPPFLMARFSNAWADDTRWARVYLASVRLLLDSGRTGSYPDWVLYRNGQMSLPLDERRGDYDAIRTYLWIAMSHPGSPTTAPLMKQLSPLAALLMKRQHMPEWIEPLNDRFSPEAGPAGFQAATAPFLQAAGAPGLAKAFHAKSLRTSDPKAWLKYGYYNGVLSLFAQGYMDRLYQFNPVGELLLRGKEIGRCD
ncbi:MAG TPA: cellulose synthase complex periplasmic endoglucanase BcsZ [Limnobacter sp.]|nr:cellulose synthase complex periplasmic endoglucanase BcsZ [Limnobacter sp.]